MITSKAIEDLRNCLGDEGSFSLDPEILKQYASDWSAMLRPNASIIVFPTSTQAVSRVLKYCHDHDISVVPSGGRTGLSGGAVAAQGEWVISLSKMNRMEKVDPLSRTVRVGAGAITQAVHEHCEPHGLTWPVDFASKGSSQVGGNIATNAGGVRVIRYGNTRQWVLSIQAVAMNGDIFEANGDLEKNNTGYDFRQLLVGSEGTLAIITEATLKLAPIEKDTKCALFLCENLNQVIHLFLETRQSGLSLSAFETLCARSYQESLAHLGLKRPFQSSAGSDSFIVLCEVIEASDLEQAETFWANVLESGFAIDGIIASNDVQKTDFWKLRETVAESIMAKGSVYQHDVSVPIHQLERFSKVLLDQYKKDYPEFEVFLFGHIGDGNLHVFIRNQDLKLDDFKKKCQLSDQHLFRFISEFQGSVSAEHGIGLLKKNALPYSRSKQQIEWMKGIKKTFDPKNLLNPGKLIPT